MTSNQSQSVYSRLAEMPRQQYVSVNVYPASDTWAVAVILREVGRPHGRLIRRVYDRTLPLAGHSLRSACEVAARELLEYADSLE